MVDMIECEEFVEFLVVFSCQDQCVFVEFYCCIFLCLFGVCMCMLCDCVEVEEVLQEVFIFVWWCVDIFDLGKVSVIIWLVMMVCNCVID